MEKRCYGCMQIKEQSPICEHCGFNENIENLPHQLPLGTVLLDQYVVGKALGQGSSGITYIGLDLNLDAPVAIKEYYPKGVNGRVSSESADVTYDAAQQESNFRQGQERFIKEARALGKFVDTPNIVHVYNFFEANNTSYIIMEYVKGVSLRTYVNMRGGKLSAKETFRIMQPVMDALEKIHEEGLAHCGVCPDNIMIQFGGAAKLLDFGGVLLPKGSSAEADSPQMAMKRGFGPAEQYRKDGNVGPWTDIYSLCATMYYCMTGEVPADAHRRRKEKADPEWAKISDLTQAQINALEKGMALSETERIGSVDMLMKALSGQLPVKEEKPAIQQETPAPKKQGKKTVPIVLAAVAAVAVIAAAAFGLRGRETEPAEVEPAETAVVTQAPETVPVVTEPSWEPGVSRAGYGEAVYAYLDAGMQVDVVGRFEDYYVVEYEQIDLLVYRDYVRLDSEEGYEFWDGYSKNNVQVFDNGMLEGEPIATLRKNTEVRVRDGKGDWLRIEWNENEGYVAADSISQWYVQSRSGSGSDVGLMLMGNYYGPVQDGDLSRCTGEILADGTKAYITLLLREDEVRVTEYDDDVAVIWIEEELFAEVPRWMLALEEDEEYESWTGYSKWDGVVYTEYQMRNELEKLYTNKEVTVLDDLPECYVVEYEGQIGYMLKDKVSETKIRTSSGGSGGDVFYGGGSGGGGGVIFN